MLEDRRGDNPDMSENSTSEVNRPGTVVFVHSLFLAVFVSWIVVGNVGTLVVLIRSNMERQKKHIISVLISDLFTGIVVLPITAAQYNRLDIFNNRRVCVFFMAVTDFGTLLVMSHAAVTILTTFLVVRFPFRFQSLPDKENLLVAVQWLFPLSYMIILMAVSHVIESDSPINSSCTWGAVPTWYTIAYFSVEFPIMTGVFICAVWILRVAKRKVTDMDNLERSVRRESTRRSQTLKLRQTRLMVVLLLIFVTTWLPFTAIALFVIGADTDDHFLTYPHFYVMYTLMFAFSALLPVVYCNSMADVELSTQTLIRRIKQYRN